MVEEENLKRHIDELQNELIIKTNGKILQEFPLRSYMEEIKSFPKYKSFNKIKITIQTMSQSILSVYDAHVLGLYHKLTLSLFIKDSIKSLRASDQPQSILHLYSQWFEGVLDNFHVRPDDYYSHTNSPFVTDLGMCSLRIIPVGDAWRAEVRELPIGGYYFGKGRDKYRLKGGPRQFIGLLVFLILKIRGFRPFYSLHTHSRFSGGFSSTERNKCYLKIAELLMRNPEMKGIFQHGWLYDPKLSEISPELAFLRHIPEQNGARVFRIGTTERAVRYSTAWSPLRRELYEKGEYIPAEYILIWPRKELLEWAGKERLSNS